MFLDNLKKYIWRLNNYVVAIVIDMVGIFIQLPSGVPVLEQCRSDVGSRHSSVGTTLVSDTGSVSDECRNVRPIRYWIPTSFWHRIPTSFRYWISISFRYWIPISIDYQRTILIWYRNFKYNKYKQYFSFDNNF